MAEDTAVGTSIFLALRLHELFALANESNDLVDYTLNNPDTLTKYKTAAQISHKVLEAVTGTIFVPILRLVSILIIT